MSLSPGEQPRRGPISAGQIIVLAVMAILAWQCADTYRGYLVRQKVREVLAQGAALRLEVDRAIQDKRPIEVKAPPPSQYVRSIDVASDGTIVMRLNPDVANGGTVTWKRVKLLGGQWVWDCGGDLPPDYYPDCRDM